MVSIMIPAKNEGFLQKTIDGIIEQATGQFEVIVGLDGYSPNPPIINHPKVKIIHSAKGLGMRKMINAMVDMAQGEFILKTDAHCIFDKGFDEKLSGDCDDNWVSTLNQCSLDGDTWARKENQIDYWYLSAPEGILENGRHEGLHAIRWWGRSDEKKDVIIDDQMSFQGSCWFTTKKHFHNMELMDTNGFGDFANEACEIGMKTWMSGGRVVINKKTWYAHLSKGKKYGRGYFLSKQAVIDSSKFNREFCMKKIWPKAIYDMRWLVEKFAPVPTWENFNWEAHA